MLCRAKRQIKIQIHRKIQSVSAALTESVGWEQSGKKRNHLVLFKDMSPKKEVRGFFENIYEGPSAGSARGPEAPRSTWAWPWKARKVKINIKISWWDHLQPKEVADTDLAFSPVALAQGAEMIPPVVWRLQTTCVYMWNCLWALVKGHTRWSSCPIIKEKTRSKTKVLCSEDMIGQTHVGKTCPGQALRTVWRIDS